jgi:8-demethyl-8-alpha-L-rhamnosyltetracenomycin-C 2'-O-methyltransferase
MIDTRLWIGADDSTGQGMSEQLSLKALAIRYGCDKWHSHSYVDKYESLFQNHRETVRRVLEIGIGYYELMRDFVPHYVHGASLKMWRDYFPNAQIIGVDIRPDTLIDEERIQSYALDQSNVLELREFANTSRLYEPFDIIIDDGSHDPFHQVLTTSTLFRTLRRPYGVYIIEDVRDPDAMLEVLKDYNPKAACFNKRPDDNLIIMRT